MSHFLALPEHNNNNNNNNNNKHVSYHIPFLPGTSLEKTIFTAKVQVADYSTFCIVCDVRSIAVLHLLNIFLVWLPNFSLNPLLLFRWFQLLPT